jgi:hypothetical protein
VQGADFATHDECRTFWRGSASIPVQAAIDHGKESLRWILGEYDALHCRFPHPALRDKEGYEKNDIHVEDDSDSNISEMARTNIP